MQRVGEVTAINGEYLEVTFCRPADCGKCHACSGNRAQTQIVVKGKASLGDGAVVEMPDMTVLKASLTAYLLPLAGLLGGAILGNVCSGSDAVTAVGALVGLGLSAAIVALTEKKRRERPEWQPVLKQILSREETAAMKKEE